MSGLRRIVCGYAGTYEVVRLVETSARVDSGIEEREAGVVEALLEVRVAFDEVQGVMAASYFELVVLVRSGVGRNKS